VLAFEHVGGVLKRSGETVRRGVKSIAHRTGCDGHGVIASGR